MLEGGGVGVDRSGRGFDGGVGVCRIGSLGELARAAIMHC
jgi:hypothetical protein